MIKRCLSFFSLLLLSTVLMAQWSVENVPNTRLQSNNIHVSDPDNLVDDETEALINSACASVRDSADIFVVVLSSIGSADSKDFATRLLNSWGIGDKGVNNGVLMLVVEDIHALEIEAGYGAEAFLPDVICGRVIHDVIIPLMRAGDFSGGVRSGAFALASQLGADTSGLLPLEVASYEGVEMPDSTDSDSGAPMFFAFIGFLAMIWCAVRTFFGVLGKTLGFKKKKKKKAEAKLALVDGIYCFDQTMVAGSNHGTNEWTKHDFLRNLFIIAIAFAFVIVLVMGNDSESGVNGLAVVALLTLLCVVQNQFSLSKARHLAQSAVSPSECYDSMTHRPVMLLTCILAPWLGWYYFKKFRSTAKSLAGVRNCPVCHEKLQDFDDGILTPLENKETEVGSIEYRHYCCPNGHRVKISSNGRKYMEYSRCTVCGGRTRTKKSSKVIRAATYSRTGLEEVTYFCEFCGHEEVVQCSIPKLQSESSSYSSSGGYSSGGGHSSGGSFGGGHSGGGGASGRW